jgi:hypothetical protein
MRVLHHEKQCPVLVEWDYIRPAVVQRKIQSASDWNSTQDTFTKYSFLK